MLLSHEGLAIPGSTAVSWKDDLNGRTTRLLAALDGDGETPPVDVLVLALGANDYHRELEAGLGPDRDAAMIAIEEAVFADVMDVVDLVRADRPDLQVVFHGYDYFDYEWFIVEFDKHFDVSGAAEHNAGLIGIEDHKLEAALADPRLHYSHHFGALQHAWGVPGEPQLVVDAPAGFPDYEGFPGGVPWGTSAAEAFVDGVHPNEAGWDVIVDSMFGQGLERLLASGEWGP